MTPREVAHRLREKWLERRQPSLLAAAARRYWSGAVRTRPVIPDRLLAPDGLRRQLADEARRLEAGHWQIFGWREVQLGTTPDWHRDPVSGGGVAADCPAHRINHRALALGVDARAIWEINRWAEPVRLAMHGWLNEDPGAIRTAQGWLADWCERNPPGRGINWTSPLEGALRLINFTWFDALVRASAPSDQALAEQERLARRIVPAHAAWLWLRRSFGSSANNHLLGELAALVVAAGRWPELYARYGAAWTHLESEIARQFAPDGGSLEQALHYHWFAWELGWQAMLARDEASRDVIKRMTAAARWFRDFSAGSEPWEFGDNDDAQVTPLTLRRETAPEEWTRWLSGENGAPRFWLGPPPLETGRPSQGWLISQSGMAAGRTGPWFIRADASPLGFGALAAHGHCDALHVSVWHGGEALIIDPGTGGYFAAPTLRRSLAAWDAHNGPRPLTDFATPVRAGTFLWTKHHPPPACRLTEREAGAQALEMELSHEAHHFHRLVRFSERDFEVRDHERAGRGFQVHWLFAPECAVRRIGADQTYELQRGERQWRLAITGADAEVTLARGQVSRAYGRLESAEGLRIRVASGALSVKLTLVTH